MEASRQKGTRFLYEATVLGPGVPVWVCLLVSRIPCRDPHTPHIIPIESPINNPCISFRVPRSYPFGDWSAQVGAGLPVVGPLQALLRAGDEVDTARAWDGQWKRTWKLFYLRRYMLGL